MLRLETDSLLNLNETISKKIFENCSYVWDVLPKIGQFIIEQGKTLDKEKFEETDKNIWIAKSAKIAKTASITGPCIIDEGAEVRHSAFIRGNAIIGKDAVVGNATELKNVILFNEAKVPHYNYVGDSVLGYKSHLGAGAVTSNVKLDQGLVKIQFEGKTIKTSLKKFGAIIADNVEVGCGSVLNPGTIIGRNSIIYALSSVRGVVKENSIYKSQNEIVDRR